MTPSAPSAAHVKIVFRLKRDADGYPPADSESLWATPAGAANRFVLDNTPFFAAGVAWKDEIEAKETKGVWRFVRRLKEGGHGTIRVIVLEEMTVAQARALVGDHGCTSEAMDELSLVAVDVPPDADLDALFAALDEGEEAGRLTFEVASAYWD